MPAIPPLDSTQSYGFTPLQGTSPGADSAASSALASGASQVSSASDALGARANELMAYQQEQQRRNQQLTDASAADSQGAIAMAQLRLQYAKDPDYQTAPQRFQADAAALKTSTLASIPDPQVQALVGRNFDQRISTNTIGVMTDALKTGNATQLASVNSSTDNYVRLMAGSSNPVDFKQNLDAMAATHAGAVAAQLISPEQQRTMTSSALRQALTLRASTDPMGAQALLQQYAPLMTSNDLVGATDFLQPRAQRAGADAVASSIIGGGAPATGGGPSGLTVPNTPGAAAPIAPPQRQAMLDQAVQGTAIPTPVLAALVTQESHWDAGAPNGGLGQVLQGTAQSPGYGMQGVDPASLRDPQSNLNFTAQYLYARGKAAGLTDADWRNPSKVAQALTAYNGGGDPDYAQHVMRYMPGFGDNQVPTLSNGDQAPDLQAQLAQAETATAGMPLEQKQLVFSRIRQNASEWQGAHAVEIAQLSRTVSNLDQAYQQGLTQQDPPEDQIRQLLPKQADQLIAELRLNRAGGDAVSAMRFASPEDAQALIQQWAPPGSIAASKTRMVGGVLAGPGTLPAATNAADPNAPETPDHLRLRTHVLGMLQNAWQQQQGALAKDPVAYVAQAPEIAPLAQAVDPNNPATQTAYTDASMALQKRMGVAQPRVMSDAQVQTIAQQLASTDPAKGDMGQQLDGLAQRFGANWPQAFGELVSVGKIAPAYQTLASMDTPGQAVARQDLQRVLQLGAQKGGLSQIQADAPPDVVKAIKSGLDDTIAPFRDTAKYSQGGIQLLTTTRNAVEHLATYYALQGQSASDALRNAYQGVVDAKYDTGGPKGAMLVPKGTLPQVQDAASTVQSGLQAADLAPIADTTGVRTPEEQAAFTLQTAQRGFWAPNKDASGLILRMDGRNGVTLPIMRANDSPVELKFNALPTQAPVMAAQMPAFGGQ